MISNSASAAMMGRLAWIVAAAAMTGAAALAFAHPRETRSAQYAVRFQVPPPEKSIISGFALSPDGRYLAFVAAEGGRSQLWIRPVDSLEARALPGTDDALLAPDHVFWSPDSTFIGFIAQRKVKKVSVNGGPPHPLTDANNATRATWGREGVILFSGLGPAIQRMPEAGGPPITVNKSEGQVHSTPQFLPTTRRFFYVVTADKPETNGIYVSALEEGAQPVRLLADISVARYSPPVASGHRGHLMFLRGTRLMAQPFDPETLRLFGEVFRVAEPVTQFSVSENGALAYTSGASVPRQELVWIDRRGRSIKSVGPVDEYSNFRLSPDETRIVFNRTGANPDIWVLDVARGLPSRVTSDPGVDNLPIWSHDGLRILWPSKRSGYFDLYLKAATGAGQDELFIRMGTLNGWGTDWSRDGKFVLYQRPGETTAQDLWIAPQSPQRPSSEQEPFPYLHSPFNERNAVFSPNGRWVAYESDESGRLEIYVQAFPLTSEKHQISVGGGASAAWRGDGAELFYQAADRNLMAVPVRAGATTFEPGVAKVLFPIPGTSIRGNYAPSVDGQRFLITRYAQESEPTPVTVVLNWQAGLKN